MSSEPFQFMPQSSLALLSVPLRSILTADFLTGRVCVWGEAWSLVQLYPRADPSLGWSVWRVGVSGSPAGFRYWCRQQRLTSWRTQWSRFCWRSQRTCDGHPWDVGLRFVSQGCSLLSSHCLSQKVLEGMKELQRVTSWRNLLVFD